MSCERCRELEQQVEQLTERVAIERERANALFVAYPPQSRAAAPPPVEPRPLRHQVVDTLNEVVSHVPGYGLARRAAQALIHR